MEQTKFKSLNVNRNSSGVTLRSGGKEVLLYVSDATGKLKIGGVTVGNMPKTLADIEANATFWADVAAYLDGIF